MKYIIIVLMGMSLGACTQAGPFVTNISRTKNGDIVVEKCQVQLNAFMGVISTENCTNQTI